MLVRPLLIKSRQRLRDLARRVKRPTRVLTLERFYYYHWSGESPGCGFFCKRASGLFSFADDASDGRVAYRSLFERNHPTTIERAENILKHRFDLLGSGPTDLGDSINWHRDFKSGKEWPRKPYHRIRITNPSDRSDIKIPWELSRLQCLTDLGRAYWLTSDEMYAEEAASLVQSWEACNPVDIGVNWACSMEVAIRAINLLWALYLFAGSPSLSGDFTRRIIRLLYYHGLHVRTNLESIAEGANTNHLIANYLGLYYLGLLFPEFDRAAEWLSVATTGLEAEMKGQVLEDGADYEGSLPYHRLVLEMFLSAYILGRKNSRPFSETYEDRLRKMVLFSRSFVGPSGLAPLIGDNDDGYIVKLACDDPSDHRPLVDLGAALFGIPAPNNIDQSEERFWYLGPEEAGVIRRHATAASTWHKASGYAIMQDSQVQVTMNAAPIPEKQFGGHKHNDLLSVTLQIGVQPVLVDAGTACYTADYSARNRSRSTTSHNTVTIDGLEQQRFFRDRLFYLKAEARPVVDLFLTAGPVTVVSGCHDGYGKTAGLIHRRTLWVSLEERMLAIRDEFDGQSHEIHRFNVRFLTPLSARIDELGRAALLGARGSGGFRIIFGSSQAGTLEIAPSVWHPRYDRSAAGQQICYTFSAAAPCYSDTLILGADMDFLGSTLFRTLERIGFSIKTPDLSVLI